MSKFRLAFVGLGGMGQCAHLRNYATLNDCEVVAAAELRPILARQVAQRYGIARVYRDHEALLAGEKNLDAIVAIQPFGVHGRLIPQLLGQAPAVLIEKPLASSVEAAERIASAAAKSGTKLYVAYHKRSDPATMWARRLIEQWQQGGQMGAMTFVRITMPPGDWSAAGFSHLIKSDEPYPPLEKDGPPAGMDAATFKKYEAFVNYYIHQVNLMRHLMGRDYRVRYADKSGRVMVVGGDGVTGVLEMGIYQTTRDWQEAALVAFERAWIRIELPAPMVIDQPGRVTVFEDPGGGAEPRRWSPVLPPVHAMRQQAMNFIAAIRGESTPLCQYPEALDDLRIAWDFIRKQAEP